MTRQWTAQDVLEIARSFQAACVLTASAELDVFGALAETLGTTAEALADALGAMELLARDGGGYSLAPGVARMLTGAGDLKADPVLLHRDEFMNSVARAEKQ